MIECLTQPDLHSQEQYVMVPAPTTSSFIFLTPSIGSNLSILLCVAQSVACCRYYHGRHLEAYWKAQWENHTVWKTCMKAILVGKS